MAACEARGLFALHNRGQRLSELLNGGMTRGLIGCHACTDAPVANGASNGTAALQQGAELARGQVWFVPASTLVIVSVPAQAPQPLMIWAAACNAKVRPPHR